MASLTLLSSITSNSASFKIRTCVLFCWTLAWKILHFEISILKILLGAKIQKLKKTICALSHLKTPMLQAPSGRLSVHSIDLLSGVTEQQYVLIFFTRLWSVGKPLLFDTQNPRIPGFLIAHAYKYKTKRQAKMKKKDSRKMTFLLISHQATLALEKYRFAHRP